MRDIYRAWWEYNVVEISHIAGIVRIEGSAFLRPRVWSEFPARRDIRRRGHKIFSVDRPEIIDFLRSFPPCQIPLFAPLPSIVPFESYRDRELPSSIFARRSTLVRVHVSQRFASPTFAIPKIVVNLTPTREKKKIVKNRRFTRFS